MPCAGLLGEEALVLVALPVRAHDARKFEKRNKMLELAIDKHETHARLVCDVLDVSPRHACAARQSARGVSKSGKGSALDGHNDGLECRYSL